MSSTPEVLMVVVGAGASYDCLPLGDRRQVRGPDGIKQYSWNEVRPPLTKDLLKNNPFQNEILARYELAGGIATEIRKRFGGKADPADTLERALGEISGRAATDDTIPAQLLAFQFYLRDLFLACASSVRDSALTGGTTNYTDLVHTARTWANPRRARICFVTFNYDMLLDHACEAITEFTISEEPCAPEGRIAVLRPHGAAAWSWQPKESPTVGGTKVRIAQRVLRERQVPDIWKGKIHVDPEPVELDQSDAGCRAVPVLALPLPGKSEETFVWPESHARHFQSLEGAVSHIVILGWRAIDTHFIPKLQEVAQPGCSMLIVTGGVDADAEAQRIESRLKLVGVAPGYANRSANRYTKGFSTLASTDNLRKFLEGRPLG